jgi:hypothetical protein
MGRTNKAVAAKGRKPAAPTKGKKTAGKAAASVVKKEDDLLPIIPFSLESINNHSDDDDEDDEDDDEEDDEESDNELNQKPCTRGRRKATFDETEDDMDHKPFTRGQKKVTEEDTDDEIEQKPLTRGRKKILHEDSDEENERKPSRRGRKKVAMEETDEECEVEATVKEGNKSFVEDTDEEDSDDDDSNKGKQKHSIAKSTVKASNKKRGRPKDDNGNKVNGGKNLKVNKNEKKKETPTSNKTKGMNISESVKTLSSFGLKPAPLNVPENGHGQATLNSSKIRLVVINGLNGQRDILLRCEPTLIGPSTSSWCEKVIADALKIPDSWTKQFNINPFPFNWHVNNTIQNNGNGYPIRLFHIPVLGEIDNNKLMEMLKYLCEVVSSSKGNKEQLIVQRKGLYWLDESIVWSDVIGTAKAVSMIRFHKGNTYPGFFEEHEDFVLTYFRREDVSQIGALYASA